MADTATILLQHNKIKLQLTDGAEAVKFEGTLPDIFLPNNEISPPVTGSTAVALVKFPEGITPFYLVQKVPIVPGEELLGEGPGPIWPRSITLKGTLGNEFALFRARE